MKNCKSCGQQISAELLKQKAKQKSDRIKQARRDAKANGEQVGAVRKYDRETIKVLLTEGYSYREISKILGCSTNVVSDTKKEMSL